MLDASARVSTNLCSLGFSGGWSANWGWGESDGEREDEVCLSFVDGILRSERLDWRVRDDWARVEFRGRNNGSVGRIIRSDHGSKGKLRDNDVHWSLSIQA